MQQLEGHLGVANMAHPIALGIVSKQEIAKSPSGTWRGFRTVTSTGAVIPIPPHREVSNHSIESLWTNPSSSALLSVPESAFLTRSAIGLSLSALFVACTMLMRSA
jgi:hypothetical protein